MTINEVINRVDSLKFNTYSEEEKIRWLSHVEGTIKRQILDTHEGGNASFVPYSTQDRDTTLLVPEPYDEMYIYWLSAQIDYNTGELDSYNRSIIMFNDLFNEFAAWYKRSHMPKQAGRRFLF